MISNIKRKKVLISIIIALLTFKIVSFSVTQVVYHSIFWRYDCNLSVDSTELKNIINTRQNFKYKCKENLLTGFLYKSTQSQKKDTLIVLAPGFNACSDNYLWQIKELLDYGWSVFAFDTTGCCRSQGNSALGFPQEIIDLEATLKFIENNNKFNFKNIALLGHSRGGYAVCCALSTNYDIAAVISISGINSAMEGVLGASTKYVGDLAYANYGFLWAYQSALFGPNIVNLRADKVLSKSNTPALIIHGENDNKVPTNRFSIISHKKEINNSNVEYYVCSSPNNSGHTDLLFEENHTANNCVISKINDFLSKSIK